MSDLILPFMSYAIVTTFTPGPNNITASAHGMRLGYRRSLPWLLGVTLGFFSVMFASGLLTEFLVRAYAVIAPWLRWIGVAYMIWLGVSLFVPHRGSADRKQGEATFISGFLLQFINPKGVLYGITVYTSFSALIAGSLSAVTASAIGLASLGFSAVSLWAFTGATLARFLANGRAKLSFNILMALLLAWCAVSIAMH
ncbi:MAG: LysE family transporter [Spirochaetota bacterium]